MTGMAWVMQKCCTSSQNGKRHISNSCTDRNDKRKWRCTSSKPLCGDRNEKRKRSCTSSKALCGGDRLTSLPDQILGQILSLLPTKNVAAMRVLSKRMGYAITLITTIDLDDTPTPTPTLTYHPRNCLLLLERFPLFKSFVSNLLLQKLLRITCFRLRLGGGRSVDYDSITIFTVSQHRCREACFPYLEPDRLNVWLSYPLAHTGLRELELTFHISNPDECKLPPQLFDFRSLEFFRVNANIKINSADIPLISLPNLKLMLIRSAFFTDPDFVPRLVSSCPSLEDLSIEGCIWEEFDRLTISSHSLRRMRLCLAKVGEEGWKKTDLVTIDTPNLEYFALYDGLPYRYSITHMNGLVEARLCNCDLQLDDAESAVQSQLSLLSAFTNVQHLYLYVQCLENMFQIADLECHLPVFRNLRTLTLPIASIGEWRWDIILLLILRSSPLLETLVFPEGLFSYVYPIHNCPPLDDKEAACLEAEGWRTNTLPSCCLNHLKRIEFGICFGIDRELNMIQFFLAKASVLEELVLCSLRKDIYYPPGCECRYPKANFEEFVSKLKELPKASNSCCIVSS